jgi:tetratricopeptide (TPR) repeat protein
MTTPRNELERLLAKLLELPPEARGEAIHSPRFQRMDLLDLLLDKGEQAVSRNPVEAGKLAWLAVELGVACRSAPDDPPVRERIVRAFLLSGGARRLAGERELADNAFDGAAFFLTPGGTTLERARVCRGIALLRWERGRLDEAAALLIQGARLYGEYGDIEEEAASLALLGILHAQEDEPKRALEPLLRAHPVLSERRPWLTVRALLCLARCLAEESRVEEARRRLDEARLLYPKLTDPVEKARAQWLEGRLSARIGSQERTEGLLVTAITRLVSQDRLPEATLAALDLTVLYAETGQRIRVHGLPRLVSGGETRPGLDTTVQTIRDLLAALRKGIHPRKAAAVAGAGARQLFRFRGLKVDALPWV